MEQIEKQYPTTLFKDGTDLTDYVFVADEGEQAHAATEGYYPHGEGPEADKPAKVAKKKAA
jgi:hypothetical protein